jgi:Tfp pilus assembly ATPase PilU
MSFKDLLRVMIRKTGSDLFLTTGAAPSRKACRKRMSISTQPLPHRVVKQVACQIMKPTQTRHFEKGSQLNRAAAIEILLGAPRECEPIKQGKVADDSGPHGLMLQPKADSAGR